MPVGCLLILVRDAKQLRFLEIVRHELQSNRAVLRAEAAGNAHSRDAGQAARNGVQIGQVHGHRIGRFLTKTECDTGGHRAGDHVALSESPLKFIGDDPAYLLRLDIVSVVIAVRQHVSTNQDAAPRFRPEAFGARFLDHVVEVAILLGAMAIAHAVETAQVRRALGRRDDVVDRDAERRVGQRNVHELRAQPDVLRKRVAYGFLDVRLQTRAEEFFRQTDAQSLDAVLQVSGVVLACTVHAG